MDIGYLNEFVVLAQVCKYHEAAELLYISASSLSKHIKALEQELGKDLFVRTSRTVELSRFGSDFLPYAVKIVETQAEFVDKFLLNKQGTAGLITIGTSQKVSNYSVMTLLPTMRNDCPGIQIQMIERESKQLIEMLKKEQLTFAIMDYQHQIFTEAASGLKVASFPKDSLVAVVPINHPLARRSEIEKSELRNESYIHLADPSETEPHFDSENLQRPSLLVSTCMQAINLVGDGYGITLLPKNHAMYYKTEKIALVPLSDALEISFYLVYREADETNAAIKSVLKYLRIRQEAEKGQPAE